MWCEDEGDGGVFSEVGGVRVGRRVSPSLFIINCDDRYEKDCGAG